jgi:hypothetical protein
MPDVLLPGTAYEPLAVSLEPWPTQGRPVTGLVPADPSVEPGAVLGLPGETDCSGA